MRLSYRSPRSLSFKASPQRYWSRWAFLFCLLSAGLLSPSKAIVPTNRPQALLYLARTPSAQEATRNYTRAKFEPTYGCYLGAFIDFDGSLNSPIRDENGIVHQDPAGFEKIVGKPHAMYFFYLGYGRRAPMSWLRYLGARNKFVHVALEPNSGLNRVQDDAYLQRLADDFARSKAKIFLRFASEMNGQWTVYSKDPAEYRQKFRLVYNVMKKRAPNVALVWCPYTFPRRNISLYYPGDDATDWVGVNMYSVTYHNNSLQSPSEHEHPNDLLSEVYNKYAARKPFMICEYAATHNAAIEGRPRPDFATRKILTLYAALPRLYPRIKGINYFDSNNMKFVKRRAYNDYSVTNDEMVNSAYKYSISSPYFLSSPTNGSAPPPQTPLPIRPNEVLRGRVRLSCFARAPSDFVTVRYKIDGKEIYRANRPDLWECLWNAGSVRPGKHKLTLEAYRTNGSLAASQTITVVTSR